MTAPRPGAAEPPVYAQGGLVTAAGAPPASGPTSPPVFQRGRPDNQAHHLRPHPARSKVVLLTVAEVAAELRVSKMTVYRLLHSGELPSKRIGSSFRITARALDEFVAGAS